MFIVNVFHMPVVPEMELLSDMPSMIAQLAQMTMKFLFVEPRQDS